MLSLQKLPLFVITPWSENWRELNGYSYRPDLNLYARWLEFAGALFPCGEGFLL